MSPGYSYRGPKPKKPANEVDTGGLKVGLVPVARVQVHGHNVRQNLGDLRGLTDSIRRYGVMQPIVVERRGDTLRLRAGHRRLAAARLAGLAKIPAVIHADALDDEDWLIASVQENEQRLQLVSSEKARAARALSDLGCSVAGIAEAFGCSQTTVRNMLADEAETAPKTTRSRSGWIQMQATNRARADLVERHRAEYDQLRADYCTRLEEEEANR